MWQNLYDRITEMTAWQSLSNVRRLRIGRITTSNFYDVVPCKFGKSKTLLNKLMNYVDEVFFMEEKWKQEPKKSYTTLVMTGVKHAKHQCQIEHVCQESQFIIFGEWWVFEDLLNILLNYLMIYEDTDI